MSVLWLQRSELHRRPQGYEPCELAAAPLCRNSRSGRGADRRRKSNEEIVMIVETESRRRRQRE